MKGYWCKGLTSEDSSKSPAKEGDEAREQKAGEKPRKSARIPAAVRRIIRPNVEMERAGEKQGSALRRSGQKQVQGDASTVT